MECWKFHLFPLLQNSITPSLHYSGSIICYALDYFEAFPKPRHYTPGQSFPEKPSIKPTGFFLFFLIFFGGLFFR